MCTPSCPLPVKVNRLLPQVRVHTLTPAGFITRLKEFEREEPPVWIEPDEPPCYGKIDKVDPPELTEGRKVTVKPMSTMMTELQDVMGAGPVAAIATEEKSIPRGPSKAVESKQPARVPKEVEYNDVDAMETSSPRPCKESETTVQIFTRRSGPSKEIKPKAKKTAVKRQRTMDFYLTRR